MVFRKKSSVFKTCGIAIVVFWFYLFYANHHMVIRHSISFLFSSRLLSTDFNMVNGYSNKGILKYKSLVENVTKTAKIELGKLDALSTTNKPKNFTSSRANSPLKIILMWNWWNPRMADEPLVKGKCPTRSCLFTSDISLIQESDVVVLHFDTLEDFPLDRRPHQRFVFHHFESPENTDFALMDNPKFRYNYFNWTMTYRRDSDIFLRDYYGSLVAKVSSSSAGSGLTAERYKYNNSHEIQPSINTLLPINSKKMGFYVKNHTNANTKRNIPSDLIALIRRKTKMVTWFVGHCSTAIRREEYVRQLGQHITIDIFGSCTNECPSSSCDEMLRNDYKFYLAFENSWCPDYVTEKFIRPFLFDAVPIVLGGADYTYFAPSHSYINARDFDSPRQLAEYLKVLDKADTLYAAYFDWKKNYEISIPDFYGWCELCRMAHDDDRLPPKVYYDIKNWWMKEGGECESNSTNYF